MKVALLREPRQQPPAPGREIRISRLRSWITDDPDVDVEDVTIEEPPGAASKLARVRAAARLVRSGALDGYDVIVVAGFGSAHMLWASWFLSRRHRVVLDVCDSVWLSLTSSTRHRAWGSAAGYVVALWTLGLASRRTRLVYISEKDVAADRWLTGAARSTVVSPSIVPDLLELRAYKGPPQRIVVPADLRSYHNSVGFQWLGDLLSGGLDVGVPIEVYGPAADGLTLPPGVRHMGWAPRLSDVYDGETAVFAPNLAPQGVQNKVWEAMCAGRPVLVGDRAAGAFAARPNVLTYSSRDDLAAALRALARIRDTEDDFRVDRMAPPEISFRAVTRSEVR